MFNLIVYVPVREAEVVKQALFAAGAGQLGQYSQCCWQVQGRGQFLPSTKASPALGPVGQLTEVDELRLEMIVNDDKLTEVIKALKQAHPYEQPAFHYYRVNF